MAESLHILILEDNRTDAELTLFELEDAGFSIRAKVVETEKDYIRELQQSCFDLILSDYDLPQYNGALALQEATRRCPDTPFILISGVVTEDRAIEILTQGAKDYVLKNRLQQRLVPAVRRALTEANEQQARKKAEEELREAHKNLEHQVNERTLQLQKELEHRRQIEQTLLRYNERLEILSYTAARLLASDSPQQIVQELCLKVMAFLDCQTFFNFLIDETAGRLHLNACAGIPSETAREIEWLDFGVAVCGCVARDGLRIIAENIPQTPDVRTELIKSFGIKAYACHPLKEQNQVIGTLSFGTRTRITFNEDELAMMKVVADQVAVAMSRVRTEEKLRQITERFEMAQHAANVGAWDWDVTTGDIQWSDRMFFLLGLNPKKSAASFEVWRSVLHPEDAEIAGRRIEEALENKMILNSDYRIILPDGRIRWINSVGEGKYDDQNRAIRMIGICMDITERKQTEEALRGSEERYRELVDSSPEAVIVHRDGQFLYANPAALGLYGARSLDQLQTRTVLDLIPDDERERIASRMERGKAGEKLMLQETKLTRLDGRVIPVESVGGAVTYNGKPSIQIMIRDITDRKRATEVLDRNKKTFSELVERAPFGIYTVDSKFRVAQMNSGSQNGAFRNARPVIGRDFAEAMHILWPEPVAREIIGHFRHTLETGEPYYAPRFVNPRRDIETIEAYEWELHRMMLPDGQYGVICYYFDSTRLREAQDALTRSDERFRSVLDNSRDVIYCLNVRTGHFEYISPSAETVVGYSPDELAGQDGEAALAMIHPDDLPAVQEALARISETGQVDVEYRQKTKQGGYRWLSNHMSLVRDESGLPLHRYGNIRDIAKSKALEEDIEKKKIEMEALVANLNEAQNLAAVGSWEWDLQTDHVLWSDETYRIFGVTPQDFVPSFESNGKFIHPDDFDRYGQVFEHSLQTGEPLDFDLKIITPDGILKYCNARGRVIRDDNGRPLRFVGTVMDITRRTQREREQEKNNRTLRALSKSNQAMTRAIDENGYMADVCKIVIEDCGYTMVWIGFAEEDEEKTVRPVAVSGFEEGYFNTLQMTWADTERGRGPTGTAIRTGKPASCRNMLTDPLFEPWRKEAVKRQYASSIALPLMAGDKAFGALNIYSKDPDPFTDEEEKLLIELANDLAYGIMTIRWREALKQSEEKYKNLVKYAPAAIYEMDIQGTKFLSVNDVMCDILGYSREELLTIKPADLLAEENRVHFQQRIEKKLAETEEYKIKRKDGRWIDITVNAGTITYADERIPRIAVIAHDITERKRAEEAILRAKEEWEQTFNTVPDLIAILDNRHRIIRVNKAMAAALGVVPEQCVGLLCHEAVHGLSEPPAFCPHSLTCKDRCQHVAEVHERRLGGDFMVSTTPLCDSAGRLIGAVHVARDITARRAAEDQLTKQAAQLQERTAQLEEANRELESFSYSVSHDLRAPLRAIDGVSRIILRKQGNQLDETTRRQFDMVRENACKMNTLIDNLLAFSRVQKTGMNAAVIDMEKLTREVWEEIRQVNAERELEFRINGLPPGYGDQALIRQVLYNLLDNAVKFTKNRKPGIVEVTSVADSGKIIYSVKDNGAGFDMEYADKLFGVFQRLHSAAQYEGTGVGLAIVQRIILRHGGRVWGEGREGEGASFYFSLSAIDTQQERAG